MDNPPSKKKEESGSSSAASEVDLSPHPVVEKIMKLGKGLSDAIELIGYLGPSDRSDFVRLYLDLEFTSYFEIPRKGAILYREPADRSEEARPTRIVVQANAELKFVQVQVFGPADAALLLRGNIQALGKFESAEHGHPHCHTTYCGHSASTKGTYGPCGHSASTKGTYGPCGHSASTKGTYGG
jgi:hypothetical protein